MLDGTANNDEFGAGVGQRVPLDSVQEFSVLTNNFTAEFGRATGGIVNVVTKSGTNAFHGTAYEFNRLSKLASNDFNSNANGLARPVFTRNQFGYSLGGPAIKDKLFFSRAPNGPASAAKPTSLATFPTLPFSPRLTPTRRPISRPMERSLPGQQPRRRHQGEPSLGQLLRWPARGQQVLHTQFHHAPVRPHRL